MNYEKKFTPGPWVIGEDQDIFTKQDIEGDVICIHPGLIGLNESQKYWEHNAHLIAAAPELLEALIKAQQYEGMHYKTDKLIQSAINKALNIKNDEL